MSANRTLSLFIVSCVALSGCGGKSDLLAENRNVEMALTWPAFTGRYLPSYAKSVVLELRSKTSEKAYTVVADRPSPTATEQVVRFNSFIPAGEYALLGVARTGFGGEGETVASASADVTVSIGRRFTASLTLLSSISSLEIVPSPISVMVGSETQVSLSARDPLGKIVFLSGASVRLEVTGPAGVANITPEGKLTGLSAGTTTIRATEVGANLSVEASVSVVPPVGQDVVWLSIDLLGGGIRQFNVQTKSFVGEFLETNTSSGSSVRLLDIAMTAPGWNGNPTPKLIGTSGTRLYQVDEETGTCTLLGSISTCNSLAVGPGNRVYSAGGRFVYELTVTGNSVTERIISGSLPSNTNGDVEYDYATQQLIVACADGIYRVYIADGVVERMGTANWQVTNPYGPPLNQEFVGFGYSRGLLYASMYHYGFSALYKINPLTRDSEFITDLALAGGGVMGIATKF